MTFVNERALEWRDRQGHRARGREGGSAMSLSIPHIGPGSPTLSAVRYTTAERSAVSFSHARHHAAGGTRDERMEGGIEREGWEVEVRWVKGEGVGGAGR